MARIIKHSQNPKYPRSTRLMAELVTRINTLELVLKYHTEPEEKEKFQLDDKDRVCNIGLYYDSVNGVSHRIEELISRVMALESKISDLEFERTEFYEYDRIFNEDKTKTYSAANLLYRIACLEAQVNTQLSDHNLFLDWSNQNA